MHLIIKLEEVSNEVVLAMNALKTKIMIVITYLEKEPGPRALNGIEVIREILYLGANITR